MLYCEFFHARFFSIWLWERLVSSTSFWMFLVSCLLRPSPQGSTHAIFDPTLLKVSNGSLLATWCGWLSNQKGLKGSRFTPLRNSKNVVSPEFWGLCIGENPATRVAGIKCSTLGRIYLFRAGAGFLENWVFIAIGWRIRWNTIVISQTLNLPP